MEDELEDEIQNRKILYRRIFCSNYPSTCYTSRKIDYSAKLNEILNQEELSSKIMINDSESISSENFESVQVFNDKEEGFDK
ncbi:hypothetical protein RhiirC2_779230 [Rhizophagus irregularis]|uniref:Uncharacterized protein n=1 Tax=Rhizophagus irregularis TaxID=588596 RepID=A0A2N1NAB3_9GLOM|nr:hypothetical protein RhiirC2_779230 [Rhizophagus irregularis]